MKLHKLSFVLQSELSQFVYELEILNKGLKVLILFFAPSWIMLAKKVAHQTIMWEVGGSSLVVGNY